MSLNFLTFVYFLSVLIHILSVLLTAIFVLPLQIKEAQVKDSLIKLRFQLLLYGFIIIALGVLSVVILTARLIFNFTPETLRYLIGSLVLLHAIGFLSFAITSFFIYRQRYEEQMHTAEGIENRKVKRLLKKKDK